MNKILFLIALGIILLGCKKAVDNSTTPPPATRYFSVTVDTSQFNGFGTASPLWFSVKSGGNTAIFVSPNPGCRVGADSVNGKPIADTDEIVLNNITSDIVVKIRFTDSLTAAGKAYLEKLLIDSTWHDRVAYWRGTDLSGFHPEPWQFQGNYSPCQQADYYNFFANGDYIEHDKVGSCNTTPPSIYKAKWQLGYTGRFLTVTDSTGVPGVFGVDTLVNNKFIYIYTNYKGQGKDYKVVATP